MFQKGFWLKTYLSTLKDGKKICPQMEARSQRRSKDTDADAPPLPPPAEPPSPRDEPEEDKENIEDFRNGEVTPHMKVHKTVVTINIEKISRRFPLTTYGCKQISMIAGNFYEKFALNTLCEFDKLLRKPTPRHDFLVRYGWDPNRDSKRNVSAQRDFILRRMANGQVKDLEERMCGHILSTLVPGVQAELKLDGSDILTSWRSDSDQLHKSFKNVRAAVLWIREMDQSKKACIS